MGCWDFAHQNPGWTFLFIVAIRLGYRGGHQRLEKTTQHNEGVTTMGDGKPGVIQLADLELRAMRDVLKVLEPLPVDTQFRVLSWAKERVKGPNPAATWAQPPAPAPSKTEELFPPAQAVE